MGHSAPVVQKKASSNGFSISFPMSKEIENEKASSNGFSVSFPLAKEAEMGNKKALSNGISISFPMEAEMEKYDNIVKKLFDFILDRIQPKETEASSKGISMIRFPLAREETGNKNISYKVDYAKRFIRTFVDQICDILTVISSTPMLKENQIKNLEAQIGSMVHAIYKFLSGLGRSSNSYQPKPEEQADEQLFPELIGSLILSNLAKGKK